MASENDLAIRRCQSPETEDRMGRSRFSYSADFWSKSDRLDGEACSEWTTYALILLFCLLRLHCRPSDSLSCSLRLRYRPSGSLDLRKVVRMFFMRWRMNSGYITYPMTLLLFCLRRHPNEPIFRQSQHLNAFHPLYTVIRIYLMWRSNSFSVNDLRRELETGKMLCPNPPSLRWICSGQSSQQYSRSYLGLWQGLLKAWAHGRAEAERVQRTGARM